MSQDKTARWLDLLAFLLQHRFPVTRAQIYESVAGYRGDAEAGDSRARESLRRKFERDKDELRALGIDIETVPFGTAAPGDEPGAGYRLRTRDFYLPYLEISGVGGDRRPYQDLRRIRGTVEDMAMLDRATRRVAAAGAPILSEAAASARRKLEFDLPLPLASVERVLSRPLSSESARTLETVQRAVVERVAVRCRYFAIGRDQVEAREIEPYGLFFNWGRWYVVAFSRERGAMRVFRLDRVQDAELVKGAGGRFEVPSTFRIGDYLGRPPWDLSESPPTRIVVHFLFPESRWVLARGLGEPVEPMLGDGGSVVAFAVRDRNPFLRWLATFRGRAMVREPEEAARELAALRGRIRALYAEAR